MPKLQLLSNRAPEPPDGPPPGAAPPFDPDGPIGIIVLDQDRQERVVQVIPADSELPSEFALVMGRAYAGLTAVRLELTIGEGSRREDVVVFAELEMTGLAVGGADERLDVVLRRTENAVEVEMTDRASGRRQQERFVLQG